MTPQSINLITAISQQQGCVYLITCKINGKSYCGSSMNLTPRWNYHKSMLQRNVHHSSFLQNDYNAYGLDNFVLSVIKLEENSLLRRKYENRVIRNLMKSGKAYNNLWIDYSKIKHNQYEKKKAPLFKKEVKYIGLYSSWGLKSTGYHHLLA